MFLSFENPTAWALFPASSKMCHDLLTRGSRKLMKISLKYWKNSTWDQGVHLSKTYWQVKWLCGTVLFFSRSWKCLEQLINNYSSSTNGLWANSPWSRRPNGLLTQFHNIYIFDKKILSKLKSRDEIIRWFASLHSRRMELANILSLMT